MVSFLDKIILNYIIFTITLIFTFFLPLQQNLKANSQTTAFCKCDNGDEYPPVIENSSECQSIKIQCDQIGNYEQSRRECPEYNPKDPTARSMCYSENNRSLEQARQRIDRIVSEFRRDQDRYRRECRQTQNELNRIKLPPGCRNSRSCRTDAEKCRDVQQRLGIASALTPTLQNALANDCPQLAKARYDDDKDRLDEVVDDQKSTLENIWELQEDVRENDQKYQEDVLRSQEEIQRLTTQINTTTTEFEGQVSAASNEISGRVAEMKDTSMQINQEIQRLSRRLNELQTDNNEGADGSTIEYRRKIREIFAQCNGQAGQAVQRLRDLFKTQAASGTVTKLSDATEENRQERLRQTAIRAYTRCRNSQETEIKLAEAAETYKMQQRARIRQEGEIIDEIKVLQERLESLSVQSESIVTAGDKAFQSAHERHVDQVQDLNTKLQMAQFNKEQLLNRFQQQQTAIQEKLNIEQPRLQKLNGEMLSLEQSVAAGRPASLFANLSRDDFQTMDEYTNQFDIAQSACCGDHIPRTVQEGSGMCNQRASTFLQRRGRRGRHTR